MQLGNPFASIKNPFKDDRDGATTVALTFSFSVLERGPGSILSQLDALAADADTSTSDGISALCASTALMLLRRQNDVLACCGTASHHSKDEAALADFDRKAIREAAKFDDRDSTATVGAALSAAGLASKGKGGSVPTVAVVCAIGCLLGDREATLGQSFAGNIQAMRVALEELAVAGNAEEEVFAFELFWVPGGDDEVLDSDEVLMDWPELMSC